METAYNTGVVEKGKKNYTGAEIKKEV